VRKEKRIYKGKRNATLRVEGKTEKDLNWKEKGARDMHLEIGEGKPPELTDSEKSSVWKKRSQKPSRIGKGMSEEKEGFGEGDSWRSRTREAIARREEEESKHVWRYLEVEKALGR